MIKRLIGIDIFSKSKFCWTRSLRASMNSEMCHVSVGYQYLAASIHLYLGWPIGNWCRVFYLPCSVHECPEQGQVLFSPIDHLTLAHPPATRSLYIEFYSDAVYYASVDSDAVVILHFDWIWTLHSKTMNTPSLGDKWSKSDTRTNQRTQYSPINVASQNTAIQEYPCIICTHTP